MERSYYIWRCDLWYPEHVVLRGGLSWLGTQCLASILTAGVRLVSPQSTVAHPQSPTVTQETRKKTKHPWQFMSNSSVNKLPPFLKVAMAFGPSVNRCRPQSRIFGDHSEMSAIYSLQLLCSKICQRSGPVILFCWYWTSGDWWCTPVSKQNVLFSSYAEIWSTHCYSSAAAPTRIQTGKETALGWFLCDLTATWSNVSSAEPFLPETTSLSVYLCLKVLKIWLSEFVFLQPLKKKRKKHCWDDNI